MLNDVVEINVISQRFVVVSKFHFIDNELFAFHFMNDKKIYCYEIYKIKLTLKNNWQRKRIFAVVFYVIDKQNSKLILNFSELKQLSVVIDYKKFSWRYNFDSSSFKLNFVKKFSKVLINDTSLYAIMTTFITLLHEKQSVHVNAIREKIDLIIDETFAIFQKFVKFQNQFFKKLIKNLTIHKNCDHANDIKNNEFFYNFLYNLLNMKLIALREYLNNVLTKNWIRHFVNSVEISVMFVFKKNENLRLCVDYKSLNKITKKNRHSLFLITQILNQLSDSAYFIKLNFKNVYHRIRIRKNDEWKTTFRTRYEHFEYMMMSFELTNASIIF